MYGDSLKARRVQNAKKVIFARYHNGTGSSIVSSHVQSHQKHVASSIYESQVSRLIWRGCRLSKHQKGFMTLSTHQNTNRHRNNGLLHVCMKRIGEELNIQLNCKEFQLLSVIECIRALSNAAVCAIEEHNEWNIVQIKRLTKNCCLNASKDGEFWSSERMEWRQAWTFFRWPAEMDYV